MKLIQIKLILFLLFLNSTVNGVILKIINNCGPDLKVSVVLVNYLSLGNEYIEELDLEEKHSSDIDDEVRKNNTFIFGQICKIILEFNGIKSYLLPYCTGRMNEFCVYDYELVLVIDWNDTNNTFDCELYDLPFESRHALQPGFECINKRDFLMEYSS